MDDSKLWLQGLLQALDLAFEDRRVLLYLRPLINEAMLFKQLPCLAQRVRGTVYKVDGLMFEPELFEVTEAAPFMILLQADDELPHGVLLIDVPEEALSVAEKTLLKFVAQDIVHRWAYLKPSTVQRELEFKNKRVCWGPNSLTLPDLEYTLLAYLWSRQGEVCRRVELNDILYPDEHLDKTDRRLDTIVSRLRAYLRQTDWLTFKIETVRRIGYRLVKVDLQD